MSWYLGIDTSNYTTSCALFDSETMEIRSCKKLLPVKQGERGLRQSDAVFHHTKQLPPLLEGLFDDKRDIKAAAYSYAPREVEGSYMPCFLVGEGSARGIACAKGIPVYRTSHQKGHILAALYSCGKLGLLKSGEPFIAFHVSGGTTDMLLCKGGAERVFEVTEIGHTLDLNAGQCIDRVGVRMGLGFPCGIELEKLAEKSSRRFRIKPTLKGLDCCLSGVENKCVKMLEEGESKEDTALFCIEYIYETVKAMAAAGLEKFGSMPVIFAGGVMSDRIIRDKLEKCFDCYFAEPALSADNAVGVAVYAAAYEGNV